MKFLSVPETPNLFATRRYNLISHYRLGTGAARVITHIFIPVIASYVTTSRKFHERSARVALINAPITIIATELELRSRAFADLKTARESRKSNEQENESYPVSFGHGNKVNYRTSTWYGCKWFRDVQGRGACNWRTVFDSLSFMSDVGSRFAPRKRKRIVSHVK